jgi:hypothetical protein
MWHPLEDIQAFVELRRRGEITWSAWLRDIGRTDKLPYFDWRDPAPSIAAVSWKGVRFSKQLLARLRRRSALAEPAVGRVDAD